MATTLKILEGNSVRSTLTLTVDGVETDPTTLKIIDRDPSGNENASTATLPTLPTGVTKVRAGVFQFDLTTDEDGVWFIRWVSTGPVAAADEDFFEATASAFTAP